MRTSDNLSSETIRWFRDAAPYINEHRGCCFVVYFSGQLVESAQFDRLIHDLGLMHALGIKLILINGARPQIAQRIAKEGIAPSYSHGLRVTDAQTIDFVLEAVGRLRVMIESKLSLSLANTPMSGSRLRVASGNYITARPMGILDGIDFQHTGQVRRIDTQALCQLLDLEHCILLSPLGYSPTGEVFNLSSEEVATQTAIALQADKLLLLSDTPVQPQLPPQVDHHRASKLITEGTLPTELSVHLQNSITAIKQGVKRCHIIDSQLDGGILQELFTRDGIGTLVSNDEYEGLRQATIDDVAGILQLIQPMENNGTLVRRSREQLELEIEHFWVIERDGKIIACAALYPFSDEKMAEIACIAVDRAYRRQGRGDTLLKFLEQQARSQGLKRLFVLSTQTLHWFREHGYEPGALKQLPVARASLYNFQRQSKIFIKTL